MTITSTLDHRIQSILYSQDSSDNIHKIFMVRKIKKVNIEEFTLSISLHKYVT